jgi:hypothetical protein
MAGVTPEQIYETLLANGYSSVQAFGIMGNMICESSLDPESVNPGGEQDGVGLCQWQTTDYPAAVGFVTGDPVQDMNTQITFLAQTAVTAPGSAAASGSTGGEVAGNWANDFEKCAACSPTGAYGQPPGAVGGYDDRVANAATVEGWASSGNWPDTSTPPASEDPDMSTQSSDGVATISFRPGTVSQLQITFDPAGGPLPLRVVLSLSGGPWVQNGPGGTGPNASLYTVDNGYATYNLEHVGNCGGVILESQDEKRVFSVVGY